MSAYGRLATLYDALMMEDIPYDAYVDLIASNVEEGARLLDIGCGTGYVAIELAKRGYDVTAIDIAPAMIEEARTRAKQAGVTVDWHVGDVSEKLPAGSFDLAYSAIDVMNYVTTDEGIARTFALCYDRLTKGGRFLFDVHGEWKLDLFLEEAPFVYDSESLSYMWQTEEGADVHSVRSTLTFFVRQDDGSYERFDEQHEQRILPVSYYVQALETAQFTLDALFADWAYEPPTDESERLFFLVRK